MRLFGLTLLGVLIGVLGAENICNYNALNKCDAHSVVPNLLPKNEEELQDVCRNVFSITHCIGEYIGNCREEEEKYPNDQLREEMSSDELKWQESRIRVASKEKQRIIAVATEICQDDSSLHARVVPDVSCFQEILDKRDINEICSNYSQIARRYIDKRLISASEGYTKDKVNMFKVCVWDLFFIDCVVEQMDRSCSSLAKDTALEIIRKAGSFEKECPIEFHVDILELLDDLKLVTKKDMSIRPLFENDSFFYDEDNLFHLRPPTNVDSTEGYY